MITKANFKDVLKHLQFVEEQNIYTRKFNDCEMAVDFDDEKLIYPKDITIHDHTTSNFEHNENFVVFECVCRLLDKGYRAEHMELEPRWVVGHGASGGKADILVRDGSGDSYIIIECKTQGREYNKEKKNTEADGGQVFSYWQQVTSTKWLALYASDWDEQNNEITYTSDVIHSEDDPNILKLAEKDASILTYRKAHNNEERFSVWAETYNKTWLNNTIFDTESQAYKVGVPPLRKGKLKDFADAKSIVNKFEEILRHNNVSDKENAFNKLVALFICKLVDEIKKSDDDIVEFQYKQGTDTYESLQDRLQRLHKQGMDEFMQEDLFYVEADYADKLFQQYTGQKRKKAIAELNETIRKLKFYTNNDFAFKDVHNEELFYQNGKILVEVVQLFQPYRIVFSSKNQVLGDLFEGLLNKGFKQSEGQFFTPMPITRFMWDALPLRGYVSKHGLPRIIDYACGAAHFLIDGVEAILAMANIDGLGDVRDNKWVKDCVFGIEKDYRLARVSKVSMFMNGAGDTNIIFGDGLENYHDKGVKAGTFDILVANPPYSVKGFKQHLALKNNTFELLQAITNDGDDIEVLFVERIAQLLKPQGMAAVILPSSIRNSSNPSCFINVRENLLTNFYIRAIVELGTKTFGATSTSTIILFLERYNEPPRMANLVNDSVDAIMNGVVNPELSDSEVLLAYVNHQGVTREEYMRFIARKMSYEEISAHPYFKAYNTIDVKVPSRATAEEALSLRYNNMLTIEREKLYYFALVYKQRTLVITSPSDNDEQKKFLGYTWSNRKGNEGIMISSSGGKLYDDKDRFKEGTLASAVRKSFDGIEETLSDDLQEYAKTYWLKDMMDFSRQEFDKSILTVPQDELILQSKYEKVELQNVVNIIRGVTYSKEQQTNEDTQWVILTADNITLGGSLQITKKIYLNTDAPLSEDKKLRKGDCFMCFSSGSKKHIGKICYIGEDTNYYAGGFMGILRVKNESCNPYYLSCLLNHEKYRALIASDTTGSNINNLSNKVGYIQIPVPPIDIQKKIIEECEAIDEVYNSSLMSIDESNQKISDIFTNLENMRGGNSLKLSDKKMSEIIIPIKGNTTKVALNEIKPVGNIPVVTQERDIIVSGYVDTDKPITDLPLVLFGDHNCTFKYINFKFVRGADGTQLLKVDDNEIKTRYLFFYLSITSIYNSQKYERHMKYLRNIQIPVPPMDIQQKIIEECEAIEQQIAKARAVMDDCVAQRRAVLDKYLGLSET